jgi:cell division septation protein DedD
VSQPKESVDTVAIRHLDDIQEMDPGHRPSRLGALVMASFGGACIVFAALAVMRTDSQEVTAAPDPLGDLVARAAPAGEAPKPNRLDAEDVTFPEVLTDQENPTTALAAVRKGSGASGADTSQLPLGPPPPTDRLPVVPLPAQDVLQRDRGKLAPSDTLRHIAEHASRETPQEEAEPGHSGGYQLQVSSFKKKEDAEGFAAALRRRGHRAYVQAAHVKGRGLWHRVRIGPFKYQRSAKIYRQDFEAKERMVTFIVQPPKTKVRIGLSD